MTNASNLKSQDLTLITADSLGERWTRDDLEFVAEFTDAERDEDLALALGRSLYSLWAIQNRIRNEGVEGVIGRRPRAHVVPVCPTHHIELTALGDCDWC